MEAAAKISFNLPAATFGQVLDAVRRENAVSDDTQNVLRKLEVPRHHHLGHGGANPFNLTPNEVDFVYLSSAAGARLFLPGCSQKPKARRVHAASGPLEIDERYGRLQSCHFALAFRHR
jgi:hypothetical protein